MTLSRNQKHGRTLGSPLIITVRILLDLRSSGR